MARHREFDEADVLDKCMKLFWRVGYEKASIQNIVKETGVNRASLYNIYGDKDGLFKTALSHYIETRSSKLFQILIEGEQDFASLAAFFEELIHLSATEAKGLGCLLTNSALEFSDKQDHDVVSLLKPRFQNVLALLEKIASNAQEKGELRSDLTAEQIGAQLFCHLQGIRAMSRMGMPLETLQASVAALLNSIRP